MNMKKEHFYPYNFSEISCRDLAFPYKSGDLISEY